MNAKPGTHTATSSLSRVVAGLLNLALLAALCVVLVGQRPVSGQSPPRLAPEISFNSEDIPHLEYRLQDGYVHNWLVAGPQVVSPARRDQGQAITRLPAENRSLALQGTELTWQYYKTADDHLVDLSGSYPAGSGQRTWAYAQLVSPSSRPVTFVLTTGGSADVWLNGQHVHRQASFGQPAPRSVSFGAELARGPNGILLCLEQAGGPETPYTMALQALGLDADEFAVTLPTSIENVERRREYERLFEQVYLEQDISLRGNDIILRWADDLEADASYTVHILDKRDRIYVEMLPQAGPSRRENAGHPVRIWEGQYRVALRPPRQDFYLQGLRYQRDIPLQIVDNDYSTEPYGTYAGRRQEALQDAWWRESGLYSEMAKMELGRWDKVRVDVLLDVIESDPFEQSPASLTGLLGILYRYGGDADLDESLAQRLDEYIARSGYWQALASSAKSPTVASQRILYYTNQVLAGQRYPARSFAGPARSLVGLGHTGRWHRARGEQMLLSWLRAPMASEIDLWDLQRTLPEYVVALSHLAELAEDAEVRTLATKRLDEMFSWLARNSFQGVYGSSHRRARALPVKSGRLAPASGISRLLWGMGAYNRHFAAVVSLACSGYRAPPEVVRVARDLPQEEWHQERYSLQPAAGRTGFSGASTVTLARFRTPDYMLGSAAGVRPGQPGDGEHVWQATLGPDALVYVTHPANMSEKDAHRNGFWHGNATLPRVAQYKDALAALYKLPEEDWMGFTHAHWPTYAFDEHAIRDGAGGQRWAFARKGDGYIALTAAQGIELIERGPSAYRELRSFGHHNVWLCLMGRAASDGSFEAFQRAVLAAGVEFEDLAVRLDSLPGETLALGGMVDKP